MRRLAILFCCPLSVLSTAALAGPMPALPDLPPLPTTYAGDHNEGFYAGVLTGYATGSAAGLAGTLVVGHRFAAADLLLGVEGLGTATTYGDLRGEISLRAGIPLADTINWFGHVGLGISSETDAFVSAGVSLEADLGDGWLFRGDYRFNHDIDGEPDTHLAMTGLLRSF
jgi:hypothetical protein